MINFTIYANESWCNTKVGEPMRCLKHDTKAYYHSEYQGGGNWRIKGTIENLICTFKNDVTTYSPLVLENAKNALARILIQDFEEFFSAKEINGPLTVCVIPRSKKEDHYRPDQKFFRQTVADVIRYFENKGCNFFEDGTQCIIRHTDTATTHLERSGHGGNGKLPYCGITQDTCSISGVKGKNILLIDDLYTKSVCIDEDAIQALYDSGANSVIFYSVGKTVRRY